jgi:hypothetical protein
MATGALMFHGSQAALHMSLAQVDDRLQDDGYLVLISDSLYNFGQEPTGMVTIIPEQEAYVEEECTHIVTKTAYLFSAPSWAARYWYVHAGYACVGALVHDFAHVCPW